MAACRRGDSLVIKMNRPARSLPDARDITNELTAAEVILNIGVSVSTAPFIGPRSRSPPMQPTSKNEEDLHSEELDPELLVWWI